VVIIVKARAGTMQMQLAMIHASGDVLVNARNRENTLKSNWRKLVDAGSRHPIIMPTRLPTTSPMMDKTVNSSKSVP
jgi:hypothetical protein